MKKLLLPIFAFILTSFYLQAQVKYSLNLLPDQETYLVSLLPEQDIEAPLNIASNIQVVLKIPIDKPFLAGEITSQIEGLSFVDNAFAHAESGGSDYALCAITMEQPSTKKLQFQDGVEIPLFTFKNLESGCIGALSLVDNTDEEVKRAVTRGYNFTQNITLLGARGNGFTGVANKVANCAALTTSTPVISIVNELKAYPIPTHKELNIEWTNPETFKKLNLIVVNPLGQIVQEIVQDGSVGFKNTKINVENYSAGLYHFMLKNENGQGQHHKFIIINKR